MEFEEVIDLGTAKYVRGIDAGGNSIRFSLEDFIAAITDETVIRAIILKVEKEKGIRLIKDSDSWGTETHDSTTDTWTATGFEEPI